MSLVLRFYKTPPRYGIEMSDVVRRSMQFAIFLHMAFGFYMFSNSQIFTYQSTVKYVEDLKINLLKQDNSKLETSCRFLPPGKPTSELEKLVS